MEVEEEEKTKNKSREGGDEVWLPMIQAFLKQYDNIFDTPRRLILMWEWKKPTNMRPYKYGHIQEEESEKLVTERWQAEIFRPSRNPYSSSVLLVKI